MRVSLHFSIDQVPVEAPLVDLAAAEHEMLQEKRPVWTVCGLISKGVIVARSAKVSFLYKLPLALHCGLAWMVIGHCIALHL